jgi:hypothetical protein
MGAAAIDGIMHGEGVVPSPEQRRSRCARKTVLAALTVAETAGYAGERWLYVEKPGDGNSVGGGRRISFVDDGEAAVVRAAETPWNSAWWPDILIDLEAPLQTCVHDISEAELDDAGYGAASWLKDDFAFAENRAPRA